MKFVNTWMRAFILKVHRTIEDIQLITTLIVILVMLFTLMTCKKCALQCVGSTITKFRLRFNNHKSRIRKHEMLGQAEELADDLLYRHFCGGGHSGLSDVKIQPGAGS